MAGKGAGSGVSGTLMGVAGQAEPRAPGGPLPPGEAHRRGHEALGRHVTVPARALANDLLGQGSL